MERVNEALIDDKTHKLFFSFVKGKVHTVIQIGAGIASCELQPVQRRCHFVPMHAVPASCSDGTSSQRRRHT